MSISLYQTLSSNNNGAEIGFRPPISIGLFKYTYTYIINTISIQTELSYSVTSKKTPFFISDSYKSRAQGVRRRILTRVQNRQSRDLANHTTHWEESNQSKNRTTLEPALTLQYQESFGQSEQTELHRGVTFLRAHPSDWSTKTTALFEHKRFGYCTSNKPVSVRFKMKTVIQDIYIMWKCVWLYFNDNARFKSIGTFRISIRYRNRLVI